MRMNLIALSILSSAALATPSKHEPARDEEISGIYELEQPEAMTKAEFSEMVFKWNNDPEFAGVTMSIRLGSNWAVIDRSAAAAKAPAKSTTALDKVLEAVHRSNAAKASLHVEWKRSYFDENGRPATESLIMDAGVAAGAAASAQSSMDEATAKNHR